MTRKLDFQPPVFLVNNPLPLLFFLIKNEAKPVFCCFLFPSSYYNTSSVLYYDQLHYTGISDLFLTQSSLLDLCKDHLPLVIQSHDQFLKLLGNFWFLGRKKTFLTESTRFIRKWLILNIPTKSSNSTIIHCVPILIIVKNKTNRFFQQRKELFLQVVLFCEPNIIILQFLSAYSSKSLCISKFLPNKIHSIHQSLAWI